MGLTAAPRPSFPRKRESRGGLLRLRHYTAVPSGFPLTREGRLRVAGMNDGKREAAGIPTKKAAIPRPSREMAAKSFRQTTHPPILNLLKDGLNLWIPGQRGRDGG